MVSGADLICIDLEDSVPASAKDSAREDAIDALKWLDLSKTAVRINGIRTAEGLADLLALRASDKKPCLLFIPMVEHAVEIEIAKSALGVGTGGFVPLIETVRGLSNAIEIAAADGVAAVMFGGGDFSSELGVKMDWEPLLTARSQLVMACAAAKVYCVDVPFIDIANEAGLADETARVKALGFHAKAAIHPSQIAIIKLGMKPTEAEVAEAKDALAAFEASGGAVIRHKGQMLEVPIVKRYQQILASA
jgi:citrate lyase subunit beta/citryl-CoA lyase/(S)-citramalyl-CoA lyase